MLTKVAPNGLTVFRLPQIQLMSVSLKARRATVLALFGSGPSRRVVQAAVYAAMPEHERLAVIRTDGHAMVYALDTVYEGRPLVLDSTKDSEHQIDYLWQDVTDEWTVPVEKAAPKARGFMCMGEGLGLGSLTVVFPLDEDYDDLMDKVADAGKNRGKEGPDYGLPAAPSDVSDDHPYKGQWHLKEHDIELGLDSEIQNTLNAMCQRWGCTPYELLEAVRVFKEGGDWSPKVAIWMWMVWTVAQYRAERKLATKGACEETTLAYGGKRPGEDKATDAPESRRMLAEALPGGVWPKELHDAMRSGGAIMVASSARGGFVLIVWTDGKQVPRGRWAPIRHAMPLLGEWLNDHGLLPQGWYLNIEGQSGQAKGIDVLAYRAWQERSLWPRRSVLGEPMTEVGKELAERFAKGYDRSKLRSPEAVHVEAPPMTQKEREAVGVVMQFMVREAVFNLLDDLHLHCMWCGKANHDTRIDCVACNAVLRPVPVSTIIGGGLFKDSAGSLFAVMAQRSSMGQTVVRSEGGLPLICDQSELVWPRPVKAKE